MNEYLIVSQIELLTLLFAHPFCVVSKVGVATGRLILHSSPLLEDMKKEEEDADLTHLQVIKILLRCI